MPRCQVDTGVGAVMMQPQQQASLCALHLAVRMVLKQPAAHVGSQSACCGAEWMPKQPSVAAGGSPASSARRSAGVEDECKPVLMVTTPRRAPSPMAPVMGLKNNHDPLKTHPLAAGRAGAGSLIAVALFSRPACCPDAARSVTMCLHVAACRDACRQVVELKCNTPACRVFRCGCSDCL